jgi:hypothetical protein
MSDYDHLYMGDTGEWARLPVAGRIPTLRRFSDLYAARLPEMAGA